MASTLAAVTATIVASYFGVAGTVIGAALASVVTVVGNALYSRSIRRVRGALPSRGAARPVPRLNWRHAAFGAVGLFLVVAGIVTGVELAAGRPLNKIVHDRAGSGTSLFGGGHHPTSPAPAPASPSRSPSNTPTTTHSTPVEKGAPSTQPGRSTSTPPTTPSSTPTPTPTPTTAGPSPTGTPTPTAGPSTP